MCKNKKKETMTSQDFLVKNEVLIKGYVIKVVELIVMDFWFADST